MQGAASQRFNRRRCSIRIRLACRIGTKELKVLLAAAARLVAVLFPIPVTLNSNFQVISQSSEYRMRGSTSNNSNIRMLEALAKAF